MRLKGKKQKRFMASAMMVIMFFTLLPNVFTQKVSAFDGKSTENEGYEIYPIPQSIKYDGGKVVIQDNVNVVFETGIDEATKNRLYEVLAIKGISYEVSDEIKSNQTNFLVGINNSNEVVDNYFKTKNLKDDELFEKIDSHIVSVNENVIAVLGKDTDSAFYGITSLKAIFNQIDDNSVRELLIKDYSDGYWRGFIEGYYGIPWSNENRKSLMEFGGDFKMNAYIFAPKDDEYHSLKWREPYPQEKLQELKELVDVGIKTKTKFIWTIHPFLKDGMNFETEESYKNDLEKIIAKFEQLYSIGVRQFGVLVDDAEGEATDQVKLMKDLEKWRLGKGDVKSFLFVPKVYTKESAGGDVNNEYLNTMRQMPESTEILWTGDTILGSVKKESFDFFKQAVGREPFMWLNWPVNDINNGHLMMGKGEMLDKDVTNFRGIVTNPMQQAQASKVALFAIADYGWNRAAFDMDKSWADSFKYIEPDAAEELHTFAKHMSDPAPSWHGLTLEESEEIRPIIQDFTKKLFRGNLIIEESKTVLAEYQEILDATNNFGKKSKNELLKKDINGWVNALRDLSESTIAYVNSAVALENGNYEEAINYYGIGEDKYTSSRSYRDPIIGGDVTRPEAGVRHLIPFAKDLSRILGEKITKAINPNDTKLALLPYTNMGYNLYWGNVQNIVDGDNARLSTMWMRGGAKEGDYVALELGEEKEINKIILEQGDTEGGAKFNYVKFQSSMDGENWADIDGVSYGPKLDKIVVENLNVKAKYVRVVPTGEILGDWISVREFSVNKDDSDHIKRTAYTNVYELSSKNVDIYPSNATLGELKEVTLGENDYVGVKLDKIREVTNIISDITNSEQLTLETSVNGVEWAPAKAGDSKIEARYVRLINKSKDSVKFDLNKLDVKYSDNDITFNKVPVKGDKFAPSNLIDGKLNTVFKPQESDAGNGNLIYKVSEDTEMKNFTIVQNPSTISEALVSVRTEDGWSEVGRLSKNINAFDTSNFKHVFEIKIEWNGVTPILHELMTLAKDSIINKDELANLINKADELKAEDYTAETWATLEESLNQAKEVLINEKATQEEVDKTVSKLKSAIDSLVKKSEGDNNNGGNNNNGNNNGEKPNVNPGVDNNNSSDTGKGEGNLPNTGGISPIIPLSIATIILLAGFVALKKKSINK